LGLALAVMPKTELKLSFMDLELPAKWAQVAAAGLGVGVSYMGWKWYQHQCRASRRLKRPYQPSESYPSDASLDDACDDIAKIVTWIQDAVIQPLDARFPGKLFSGDCIAQPSTPLVLVIGNHSAGKSTFINSLLGLSAQETGVAPTDDGFTVLERKEPGAETKIEEDGPTLLGNRSFKGLLHFGQPFWGHLRRKRMVLPANSEMPYGIQIVDTPGMIDMPTKIQKVNEGGRGYNFLEVVRWFAKRADLILLLFDPDKPGTTGETLEVLTKSLQGLDHKFLIVLNKVDQLDNSVDFARAYGTLCWALSKVIPRKDIPAIYTMYNAGVDASQHKEHKLPLANFRAKRDEVVQEVMRAKSRHWDNIITGVEDTLRHLEMVCTIVAATRRKLAKRKRMTRSGGGIVLGVPALIAAWSLYGSTSQGISASRWAGSTANLVIGTATYFGFAGLASWFLREANREFETLQIANLDQFFAEEYEKFMVHTQDEDTMMRWGAMKPKVANIIRAAGTVSWLPQIQKWETERLKECLEVDVPYLRQLALVIRTSGPGESHNGR